MRVVHLVVALFLGAATLPGADARTIGVSKTGLPHRATPKYPGADSFHPPPFISAFRQITAPCLSFALTASAPPITHLVCPSLSSTHSAPETKKCDPSRCICTPQVGTTTGPHQAPLDSLTLILSNQPFYSRRTLSSISRPRTCPEPLPQISTRTISSCPGPFALGKT